VSLFWNIIAYKKSLGRYSLKRFSDAIGVNKSAPSRWFSGDRPNWQINTIADIAKALDVEIVIRARDRQTGVVFAPHGMVSMPAETKGMVLPPANADNKLDNRQRPSPNNFEISAA
jgi:hypothetical protein